MDGALEKICGDTRYDLVLFDYDLPGVNGLELTAPARGLDHRARTPIVVLSATPVGGGSVKESPWLNERAWRAKGRYEPRLPRHVGPLST